MVVVLAQALDFLSVVTGEGGLLSQAFLAADGLPTLLSLSILYCSSGMWWPLRAIPSATLSA